MNNSRDYLMECLARELLTWPLTRRQKFIHEWEFGRRKTRTQNSMKGKGAAAGAELKRHVIAQCRTADEKRKQRRKEGKQAVESLCEVVA